MYYDYPLYRPPSEAYSLILQVTIGCSHNACTFCTMYKDKTFRRKNWAEIEKMIEVAAEEYKQINRIFLADGNALSLPADVLAATLEKLYKSFPQLERVSIYGAPQDILKKDLLELQLLKEKGLNLVYMGIESGSDEVLKCIKKGVTASQMIEAGRKIVDSGLKLSATVISGLGGQEMWKEHALETAKIVSKINPHYLASLTLLLEQGAPMLRSVEKGEFVFLTPWEILREIQLMLQNVELKNCVYRSNHASNYFRIAGVLNEEKERILGQIDQVMERSDIKDLPPDYRRRL